MSSQTETRETPPFCNPDKPPLRFADYPQNFDMIDTPKQMEYWNLLREPLRRCTEVVFTAYERADAAARRHQRRHRLLANFAALFGTTAVLFAIFQLALPQFVESLDLWSVPTLETLAALAALAAVVLGIMIAGKARWLLERHQAERLRLVKFRFLIGPEIWCGEEDSQGRMARLSDEVNEVTAMKPHQFREWAEELGRPDEPPESRPCSLDRETLDQLVNYYRTKRLIYQELYFHDRTRRNVPMAWLTGWLAPVLFFGSVASVLMHYLIDLFVQDLTIREMSHVFIFLAAALPTVGAGIRTIRSAHEFARNKVRYRAKEIGLMHLDKVLLRSNGAEAKISDMEFCERALELEHREWARLMNETEVFP